MSRERIIIDTNLLLLLLVGMYDPSYIARHKRTNDYSAEDFEMLVMRLEHCEIVFVSNVLTEVSNLLWLTPNPYCDHLRALLKELIHQKNEHHVPAKTAVVVEEFSLLGLTDASLIDSSPKGTILTVDLDLYLAAQIKGLPSENFNHLRFN